MPLIGKAKTNYVSIIRCKREIFHRCHECCSTENFLKHSMNKKDLF